MSATDFDASGVTREAMVEAAKRFTDRAWAEVVLAKWQEEATQPYVRSWIYQLGILAANSLGRAEEFIPLYDKFLCSTDSENKPDWHAEVTDYVLPGSLLEQSGRIGQDLNTFSEEFKRTVTALGLPDLDPILDVGCAGGAYSVNLARFGFHVVGTDHHAGVIEAAKRNAAANGVTDKATFVVDDACASQIRDGTYSRAICIGVTPCLPNDKAFESLLSHLDRVTRPNESNSGSRRVVLGSNRWGPSRLTALRGILSEAQADVARAATRLNLMQACWWMWPIHLEIARKYFANVTQIGETTNKVDGVRLDLLLQ